MNMIDIPYVQTLRTSSHCSIKVQCLFTGKICVSWQYHPSIPINLQHFGGESIRRSTSDVHVVVHRRWGSGYIKGWGWKMDERGENFNWIFSFSFDVCLWDSPPWQWPDPSLFSPILTHSSLSPTLPSTIHIWISNFNWELMVSGFLQFSLLLFLLNVLNIQRTTRMDMVRERKRMRVRDDVNLNIWWAEKWRTLIDRGQSELDVNERSGNEGLMRKLTLVFSLSQAVNMRAGENVEN